MSIAPSDLYEQLFGDEDGDEDYISTSDKLIDLVIHSCDIIAEQVNSMGELEKIRWLLDNGLSPEEIKEFVGKE